MNAGITSVSFYISLIFGIILTTALSRRYQYAQFWRFLGLLGMIIVESKIILNGNDSFDWISNEPTHIKIHHLHHYYIYTCLALSQIGPVWFPVRDEKKIMSECVTNLQILMDANLNMTRMEHLDVQKPFMDDPKFSKTLQKRMNQIIQDQEEFKRHPELKILYEKLLEEKREERK